MKEITANPPLAMNCKAISMWVVLLALVSSTQAISCYQCSTFDLSSAPAEQQAIAGGLLAALGSAACDENSTSSVCALGTACSTLDMSSKLSGNVTYTVAVQTCTTATADTICAGIALAATPLVLESCSAVNCETDGCNSGFSVSVNLALLFSVLFAALRI